YGAGMIVGAALAPQIARHVSFGTLILLGPFAGFCAAAVMFATLWMPSVQLVGLSFFLFGVGPIIWTISTMTLRQAVTPNAMLGRVSALIMTATFGARPVGAAMGAAVAAHLGIAACLALATAGFLVQLLVIGFSQVPRLRDLSELA
ncbi:MFS transporter, partial [Bosea sp. CER48]|uniref:MFS transporter n=1 Tax=Bosea sp. CER48 TaxID=3377035 RepID=UPI0038156E38